MGKRERARTAAVGGVQGELVLAAMPAAGGVLVPFEMPDPTPSCADH
ncbi:hypothetical protein AB0A76_34535 [Streptomyces exfoliatus]|uniref:Uncharacterized protein n=1 Tax=Streptomyces exfoliatus TaxID=1905 RepID=A0ABV3D8K9_STREX